MFYLSRLLKPFSIATGLRAWACVFLAILMMAVTGIIFYPRFTGGQQVYQELISSSVPYYDLYKSGDVYFVFFIACVGILFFLASAFIGGRYFPKQKEAEAADAYQKTNSSISSRSHYLFLIITNSVLLYFSLTGFLCLYAFHPRLPIVFSLKQQLIIWAFIFLLAAVSQTQEFLSRKVVPILQLGLPFLLLRFLRISVEGSGKLEIFTPNTFFSSILILILLLVYLYQVWCVGWRQKNSFWAFHVGIISAFLAYKIPTGQALTLNGYHTGEMLLPFTQFISHQMRMYADFVSVHGLLAFSYGAVHHFFFNGTYASVAQAFSLTDSIYAGLIGFALCLILDARIALLIGLYVLPSWNRYYLFPLVLLVLGCSYLEKRKSLWLLFAILLGVISFLFDHEPGLAILLALVPFILWRFFELESLKQKAIVFAFFLILVFVLWTPLLGAADFVIDNGLGNQAAFGVSMSVGHTAPAVLKFKAVFAPYLNLISEMYKAFKFYGWLLGILGILAIFFKRKKFEFQNVFLAGFPLIFSCALIPYAISGITGEGLGRVGGLTVLVLASCLPIVFFSGKKMVQPLGLALLFLSFFLHITPSLKEYISPLNKATAAILLPEEAIKAKTGPEYPPNLGEIYADYAQIEAQKELHRFITQNLKDKNDGYFDFTNQQNYFFIHDRAYSYGYPTHILAANEVVQSKVLKKLDANPPKFILFAPINAYDWFNFNMRAYRYFKWVFMHEYTSVVKSDRGTFSFFMKNDNPNAQKIAEDMKALSALIFQEDLNLLPAAWGRSWDQLNKRFSINETKALPIDSGRAKWNFSKPISGLKNDFLLLKLNGSAKNVGINFTDSFGTYRTYRFQPANTLLIPLGSDPRWISSREITSIAIDLDGSNLKEVEATLLSLER